MATNFKSNSFALFVPIVALMVIGCNSKTEEKATEKTDAVTDTTASTSENQQAKPKLAGMEFTAFYADSAYFIDSVPRKRIFFALRYIQGLPALSGWATNNGDFSTPPDITLKKAAATEIMSEDTIYNGNVKLDKKDVDTIKARIKRYAADYVVFYPKPSSNYPGHIQYEISYTNTPPAANKNLVFIENLAGTTIANPSPPKTNN